MYLPHWRVDNFDDIDQNIFASMRLDKVWSEIRSVAKQSALDRFALLHHVIQFCAGRFLIRHSFFPTKSGTALPKPPKLFISLTIQRALTCNSEVALIVRIKEWR